MNHHRKRLRFNGYMHLAVNCDFTISLYTFEHHPSPLSSSQPRNEPNSGNDPLASVFLRPIELNEIETMVMQREQSQ